MTGETAFSSSVTDTHASGPEPFEYLAHVPLLPAHSSGTNTSSGLTLSRFCWNGRRIACNRQPDSTVYSREHHSTGRDRIAGDAER